MGETNKQLIGLGLKIVSSFCDLAGTEQDHVIKLHDTINVQTTTQVEITLDQVRFAIRKLGTKL